MILISKYKEIFLLILWGKFIISFGSYVIYLNFSSPHALEMRFRNKSFESKTYMGLSFYRRWHKSINFFPFTFKFKFHCLYRRVYIKSLFEFI